MRGVKLVLIVGLIIVLAGCTSQLDSEQAVVADVTDGDTVKLEGGDDVRLIGVDTPEKYGKVSPDEFKGVTNSTCLKKYSYEATKYMEGVVDGKTVNLSRDVLVDNRGSYGRLLRYISKNGTNYNRKLVERGLARVYVEGEFSKKTEFLDLQEKAMTEKKGLWACT